MLHVVTVAVLCLGLSAISVGLGARMPNLREDDPSKIAAGFGGTLNLLVSLVFIFLIVVALALPCQILLAGRQLPETGIALIDQPYARFWLLTSMVVSLGVGLLATYASLRVGIRSFERMEL